MHAAAGLSEGIPGSRVHPGGTPPACSFRTPLPPWQLHLCFQLRPYLIGGISRQCNGVRRSCSSFDTTALNIARARLQVLERFPDDGIANAEEARVRFLSCAAAASRALLLCGVQVRVQPAGSVWTVLSASGVPVYRPLCQRHTPHQILGSYNSRQLNPQLYLHSAAADLWVHMNRHASDRPTLPAERQSLTTAQPPLV